ncbi:GntR family transcriptional regulator [Nonomuraea sp. NPDC059194]|uniref:GntR family transcriptional regulator n=1 Tax=Nonomuraea sp. NPDC059194 TaxID=3346764 RepID=UPI00369072EC
MIDYESEFPVYLQVANSLRERIEAGEWQPRKRLPTVTDLVHEYGVARNTMMQAMEHLRSIGYVYTIRNRGSFVRYGADMVKVVELGAGARSFSRRASEDERERLELEEDGWVTVIEYADGEVEVHAADKVEIRGPRT